MCINSLYKKINGLILFKRYHFTFRNGEHYYREGLSFVINISL